MCRDWNPRVSRIRHESGAPVHETGVLLRTSTLLGVEGLQLMCEDCYGDCPGSLREFVGRSLRNCQEKVYETGGCKPATFAKGGLHGA